MAASTCAGVRGSMMSSAAKPFTSAAIASTSPTFALRATGAARWAAARWAAMLGAMSMVVIGVVPSAARRVDDRLLEHRDAARQLLARRDERREQPQRV